MKLLTRLAILAFLACPLVAYADETISGSSIHNPNPETSGEDYEYDYKNSPGEEEYETKSTGEDGTMTNGSGEEDTPSEGLQGGPGNSEYPEYQDEYCEECGDPCPRPEPPSPGPEPDPYPYPTPPDYPPSEPDEPDDGCFTKNFRLFGPGGLARGSVRFFTHEFRNPGRVALTAVIPSSFTINTTTLPHPDDANFTYKRINFIDAVSHRIEFQDAPAALLAEDPNAFVAIETNQASQEICKTTVSFVTDNGTSYFRMDVEKLGKVTRYQQTNPELNKLVLETGHLSGSTFTPLRRKTTTKNFDNPNLRKERITVEERASGNHQYVVVADRELWTEAFMKPKSAERLGLKGGSDRGSKSGAASRGTSPTTRLAIPEGSAKGYVRDSTGKFYLRQTPHHYWRVVREIIAPDSPNPLVNTWDYYAATNDGDADFTPYAIGRIKSYKMHDGRQARYSYTLNRDTVKTPYAGDPEGKVTVATWNPTTKTRTITSTVGSHKVFRLVSQHTPTSVVHRQEAGDGRILKTEIDFVPDRQVFGGFPTRVLHPDNTLTTYSYHRTSVGGIRTVMEEGATDTEDGTTVSDGMRTTTVTNSRGRTIYRETRAKGFGDAHDAIFELMAVIQIDAHGRPEKTLWFPSSSSVPDGEVAIADNPKWETTTEQFCCGPNKDTDRYGIATFYAYDGLKRRIKSNRLGVTTETHYLGLTMETHRYAEAVSASLSPTLAGTSDTLVSRSVRNLTGTLSESWSPNPTSSTPGALVQSSSSTTTYQPASGLSTRVVTTTADGFSQTTENFLDGRIARTYGDLSPAMQYSYSATASGTTTTQSFDDNGTLRETSTSQSDWAGRTLRVDYMDGAFATMTYNSLGQMVQSIDPDGVVTLMKYNSRGEQFLTATDLDRDGIVDYGSDQVSYTETSPAIGEIDGVSGPVYKTLSMVWQPDDTSFGEGTVTSIAMQAANGLRSSRQSIGVANASESVTNLAGQGNWTLINTSPDLTRQNHTYTDGLLVSSTLIGATGSNLGSVTYGHDALNRQTSATDSRTGAVMNNYLSDTADIVTSVTDGGGRTTRFSYDVRGRRTEVNAPDTLVDESNPNGAKYGNVTTTSYFPDGNVAETTGDQTYRTTHLYDYADRQVSMKTYGDPANPAETTWTYSGTRGFLTRKQYADGNGTDYTYKASGRLFTRAWARGVVTTYSYDNGGRLVSTTYSNDPQNTPAVGITYDCLGRQVTQSNGIATSTFSYDAATLQLDTETIAYNLDGQPGAEFTRVLDRSQDNLQRGSGWQMGTLAQYNAGWVDNNSMPDRENQVSYAYGTADGRLATVSNGTNTFTYAYLANSNLISTVSGPSHIAANGWDATRDVLLTKKNHLGITTISQYDYTVNSLGQRTNVSQEGTAFQAARSIAWAYDQYGQVVSANSSVNTDDRAFEYDGIGNRLKSADSLTLPVDNNYSPNALNQYAATPYGSAGVPPAYDLDGNMTSGPLPANTTAHSALAWDAEHRLIETTVGTSGSLVRYSYDSQSRRIAKTVGTTTTLYVYDGWNPIAEYSIINNQSTITRSYTWGLDLSGSMQGAGGVGGLLAVKIGSNTFYPTFDGNGNVSEYLDSASAVTAHFEYDPFGRAVINTDSGNLFAHRFSTKQLDSETGLYYYGYRYYDPNTGRWPSRDPIQEKGGVNLYGFVGNDGVGEIDVLGMNDFYEDLSEGKVSLNCHVILFIGHNNSVANAVSELKKRKINKCSAGYLGAIACSLSDDEGGINQDLINQGYISEDDLIPNLVGLPARVTDDGLFRPEGSGVLTEIALDNQINGSGPSLGLYPFRPDWVAENDWNKYNGWQKQRTIFEDYFKKSIEAAKSMCESEDGCCKSIRVRLVFLPSSPIDEDDFEEAMGDWKGGWIMNNLRNDPSDGFVMDVPCKK